MNAFWMNELMIYGMIISSLTILFSGYLIFSEAYAQSAVGGVNDAFGGVSSGLRGVLDAIHSIELFFGELGCHFQGLFGGYDNLPKGSVCL